MKSTEPPLPHGFAQPGALSESLGVPGEDALRQLPRFGQDRWLIHGRQHALPEDPVPADHHRVHRFGRSREHQVVERIVERRERARPQIEQRQVRARSRSDDPGADRRRRPLRPESPCARRPMPAASVPGPRPTGCAAARPFSGSRTCRRRRPRPCRRSRAVAPAFR